MEIVIRILIIFITFQNFAQVSEKRKVSTDTININFDYPKYQKLAYDSIKNIYENQKYLIGKDKTFPNTETAISMIYDFKKLKLVSIPEFKIKRISSKEYSCKKNIEDFIDFNQDFSFQKIIIKYNDTIINYVDIPNYEYELSRINKENVYYNYDKLDYKNHVLNVFIDAKKSYSINRIANILNNKKTTFFFTIFGLRDILFELDDRTKELYINFVGIGSNKKKRMLANDYIRNFIGINIIKEMSLGKYDSGTIAKTCKKKSNIQKKNVFVLKEVK